MEIHFQRETDLKGFKLQSEKEEEKKLWETWQVEAQLAELP